MVYEEVGAEITLGIVRRVAMKLLPPIISFGAPVQRGRESDESLSFWHIPISIKPRIFGAIGPAKLGPCEILLERIDAEGRVSDTIKLAWGDNKFSESFRDEIVLQAGKARLVPVVARREGEDAAQIADVRYFQNERPKPLQSDREKHKVRFCVCVLGKKYRDKKLYLIRVPRGQGNNQFSLEIEYEGGGSSITREPVARPSPADDAGFAQQGTPNSSDLVPLWDVVWTRVSPNDDDALVRASEEFVQAAFDRRFRAWGCREGSASFGEIPHLFWKTALIDPLRSMASGGVVTQTGNNPITYVDVVVDRREIESTWPKEAPDVAGKTPKP